MKLSSELFGTCVFDDVNNRILYDYFETNEEMTVAMCLGICSSKGFDYAGLEWQCECHCGNYPVEGRQILSKTVVVSQF